MRSPQYWIDTLALTNHAEGGAFSEIFRSQEKDNKGLSIYTHIYFLLAQGQFSAFHRLQTDELWHFYAGGPLQLHIIEPDGMLHTQTIGHDPANGQAFCTLVKGQTWFAAEPAPGVEYSLCGCTMAPGFEYSNFELAKTNELVQQYPMHRSLIELLSYS